jgi:dTMP kinase
MQFDWFLFDLDGTLTESGEGITNSVRYALCQMGRPVPEEADLRRFIGPPLSWSFVNIARLTEAEAQRAVELYRARYAERGWQENRVYPGIAPLLKAIRARGGHIALASAKPEVFCIRILEHFGLLPYFERVSAVTLADASTDKFGLIRRALPEGTDPSRAVMVGDRKYDAEGAQAAGIAFVAAGYGYGTIDEFDSAIGVAASIRELHMLLLGEAPGRGYFITFEGGDGCGKSTQFSRAQDYFARRGWDVVSSREPGGCEIAERIRALVLDASVDGMTAECEALLYAAARAQHVREVIRPAVAGGKLMLCDRFLDSSIAFQAYGRELTEPAVRQINALAVDNLSPDLTLLYILDAKTARERVLKGGAPDRIEREGDAFVARVRHGYETLANREPGRFVTIDAARGISDVFPDTARAISELIDQGS